MKKIEKQQTTDAENEMQRISRACCKEKDKLDANNQMHITLCIDQDTQ